ncbi:hypothetical protein D9757_013500 [Collybiopsis confluens]|uniref:Uncharacterized protein n=1 Tax=Collybiopsis confluens TaxID=2823264 RepID=A0A8H5CV80_9AGAR|nr:hypothetical protein D9757_013500 [Collybiopsis confluens]
MSDSSNDASGSGAGSSAGGSSGAAVGQLGSSSQLGAQQAAPSLPVLPPFASAQAQPRKSLFDTFPLVEASTLLEVARHELRPMDLRKLDSKLRDKADDEGSLGSFVPRASSSKDYPSLTTVISPLTLYFRILTQSASSGGKVDIVADLTSGLFAYIDHLHFLNSRYDWSAVLQYHMAFHGLRRRDMINGVYDGWAKVDQELWTLHLWSHERAKRPVATAFSGSASKGKRLPMEQQPLLANVCTNAGNATLRNTRRRPAQRRQSEEMAEQERRDRSRNIFEQDVVNIDVSADIDAIGP